jgi:Holliday junction DNA helicase RuvA
VGIRITLHTHLVVREDAHQLYGFLSLNDRKLFRDLLKVNGIGAKSALSILSGMDANSFVRCILDNDLKLLTQIPGVGKKTAERLVIEMRDRLSKWDDSSLSIPELKAPINLPPMKQAEADAVSALISLGYKLHDASKMVGKVSTDGLSSAELIRLALQSMVN